VVPTANSLKYSTITFLTPGQVEESYHCVMQRVKQKHPTAVLRTQKPPKAGPCGGLRVIKLQAKKPNYMRLNKLTLVPDFERFSSFEKTAGLKCVIVS